MPVDRDFITKESSLASVADAIRARGNTSSVLNYPNGFVSAIGNIGNYMVGATVAWNQFINLEAASNNGVIFDFDSATGIVTYSGTPTTSYTVFMATIPIEKNHKIYIPLSFTGDGSFQLREYRESGSYADVAATKTNTIAETRTDATHLQIRLTGLATGMAISGSFQIYGIDLTLALGSTIADYLYTLESGTPGAGVAKFRELFNESYYPYDAGSLKSVQYSEWQQNSSIVLNGILNLVNNVWVRDGDIYNNGEVTRKYATLTNQSGAIGDTITLTGAKSNLTDLVSTKGHLADIGTISGTTLTLTVALSGDDIVYELATPYIET